MYSAGLTPINANSEATIGGAWTMALSDTIGTLSKAKLANVVVVARNPLADIANMRSLTMTVNRGRVCVKGDYLGSPTLRWWRISAVESSG